MLSLAPAQASGFFLRFPLENRLFTWDKGGALPVCRSRGGALWLFRAGGIYDLSQSFSVRA